MRQILNLSVVVALILSMFATWHSPDVQGDEDPGVEAILEQMSPEERVGQLFLVTFYGTDTGPDSDIAALITRYRVGGVVLMADHDNFVEGDELPVQVLQMTVGLQTLAASTQQLREEEAGPPIQPGPYVPLLIGAEHDGSGPPHMQILAGMSPLASNMAIGATWNPEYAGATGEIVGHELEALGINLLLGPSADVLEIPQPFAAGDLGTWVFGGEAFWVSEMITAYVRGVHEGSNNRVLVVPRHFPGHGGADRLANVEVPTVRRSLAQLTQVDLAPFFAVTGNATDPAARADGVLTGHIRYLGFQGDNPRLATRPISLDPQALQVLMALGPIGAWREDGGLVITDALGLRGVRRFYDPEEILFPSRRIAQDAFLAGNDVLYLGEFGLDPQLDQTETIIDTIEFFVQTYNEDPGFRTRVDDAVRRILRKKLDMYGEFALEAVLPDAGGLETLGQGRDVTFNVAQDALTLLSPAQADLLDSPKSGEKIVIFTDTRQVTQCSFCEPHALIAVDALQTAIFRLYGPEASGVVNLAHVQSFSFEELSDYLEFVPLAAPDDEATPEPDRLGIGLANADWIVFVMLDVDVQVPHSDVVRRFLAEQPASPDTRLVVMAMSAPYYLDSTEISKLAAYYALYGYTEPFVDIAARALFQGAPFSGAPPVSVSGIDYDILKATAPDPAQVITLQAEAVQPAEPPAVGEEPTAETTPSPEPVLGQGETLRLNTGVITDLNGHPVPNGTPVEFVFNYVNEGLRNTVGVTTVDGVAQTSVQLTRPGELRVSAISAPALVSDVVVLIIGEPTAPRITYETPVVTHTPTLAPTVETPEVLPSPIGATPAPPTVSPTPPPPPPPPPPDFGDLLLSMLGLLLLGGMVFWFGATRRGLNQGLLFGLSTVAMGLLGYDYYALALPGARTWGEAFSEIWAVPAATWLGAVVGLGLAMVVYHGWGRWRRFGLWRNRR